MKTLPQIENQYQPMSEEKKIQVLALIYQHWDDFYTINELAWYLQIGFCNGEFGNSEHYQVDEYIALINIVDLEKNPLPIVEEEPIVEPLIEE